MISESDGLNYQPGSGLYNKILVFLRRFYVDLRKHTTLFVSCILIVTALFLGYNIKKSNTYHASFTIVYEELVRKVYGDRLEKLNNLLQNNKFKAQALLKISQPALATLNEINATNILGDDLTMDMNTDKIPFVVTIRVSDTGYIKEIQDGVISYLETGNEYLIEKRRLKRAEIESELNFITEQLAMMDTFKRKYNAASSSTQSEKTSPEATTGGGSIYQLSYELYKKKQELLKKKEMPLNLYVIDDAIVPVKDSKPYVLVIFAGIFIGFIFYLGILYFVLPVIRYKES